MERGIDMMDCVLPSRSGRTGQAWTRWGQVNIKNARHQDDPRPLDEDCSCPTCRGYSRAYLHHLDKCGEMLGSMLNTIHNLRHYQRLMAGLREAIQQGTLASFVDAFFKDLAVLGFLVIDQRLRIDRLIELSRVGIDTALAEERVHAEGARLVGNNRHDEFTDVDILQHFTEQADKNHGG